MYVEIICYKKVYAAIFFAFFKLIEEGGKIGAQSIVAVYNLEILSGRIYDSLVYSLSVATVFLMYNLNDARIFFCISVCYLTRFIG